jgi:protein-disulfide isomerase
MSSRTGKRAQLREERQAREAAAAAAKARKRRLYTLGGGLLAAAAIVVIVIVVSSGGGSSSKNTAGGEAGVQAVTAELAGIPQSGTTLGQSTAPVTITEFADLQCPVCRDFNTSTFNQLVSNEIRSGKVKMVFRNLQTATGDPATFKTQSVAALAAGKQNKLWHYVELFYRNQGAEGSGYVTESFLNSIAKSVPGLDFATWTKDRGNPALDAQVGADQAAASGLGFNSTPSFVVKGPKFPSQAIVGNASYSQFQKAIAAVQPKT